MTTEAFSSCPWPYSKLPEDITVRELISTAIRDRQIVLFRQPIITPRSDVRRFEVLSRLAVEGGYSPAANWISAVMKFPGLARRLDWYAIEMALRLGIAPGEQVWLNVCGHSFDSGFTEALAALLLIYGIPPSRLCIEITEQVGAVCSQEMYRLRALGVEIALDDVGAGYSNLSAISSYPHTWVKIDGVLVSAVGNDYRRALVVRYLARLGKALGLGVVAEWVETTYQATELVRWGVDGLQGFNVPRMGEGVPKLWS